MAVGLYMDHHVPRAITTGLRLRNVDVVTAHEDGANLLADPELLDRAMALGRVLFTQDDDLLVEANQRLMHQQPFNGVIYGHQLRVSIGRCVSDLELLAVSGDADDFRDRVYFLPL